VKVHAQSVVRLHDLYHRKEGNAYILGNPETGEYLFASAAELRAAQLLNAHLTVERVQELLNKEQEKVDVHKFLHALNEKKFIHKIDNRVLSPKHEPLHDASPRNIRWLGGPSVRFLLILLTLFGLATFVWKGTFPTFTVFFYQQSLTLILLSVIVLGWALLAVRQLLKYAAAQYLGIPARFGFTTVYHAFIPKTYLPALYEEQEHYILGVSLLSLTGMTSVALMLSAFLPYPYNPFWSVAFAVGFIEIIAECVLFMDTDLAQFIGLTANVHKLNKQTAKTIKEEFKLGFAKKGSHPAITRYAFFYLLSIVVGVLLGLYIFSAALYFLLLAFQNFTPGGPFFIDAFIALLFLSVDLLLYAFATLRHHPLSHNTFFVSTSLLAITVASYILAAVGLEVFTAGSDGLLAVIFTFALGAIIALLFEYGIRFAKPFSAHHTLYESAFLPIVAACIPIAMLFTVTYSEYLYIYALVLGIGMLTALGCSYLHKVTVSLRTF
jgi:hypothetical protein